jgi:hypothetical protein
MASAVANPRRRPAQAINSSMTPSLIDSFQSMSLRKGDTFHPKSDTTGNNEFWDPLESRAVSPPMPPRSTTCPKSLEDLLIGSGERRAADLLARVDKAVKAQSELALANVLTEPEVLPIPTFTVHDTTVQEGIVRKNRTHSHSSDSGIGSSIADSEESATAKPSTGERELLIPARPHRLTLTAHAASPDSETNQSFSGISTVTERRGLSKYACQQIHKHIVLPILSEEALKEFHPLIKGVPHRIGKKEIKNLRDLEKTLIFLAPVSSRIRCFGMRIYSLIFLA